MLRPKLRSWWHRRTAHRRSAGHTRGPRHSRWPHHTGTHRWSTGSRRSAHTHHRWTLVHVHRRSRHVWWRTAGIWTVHTRGTRLISRTARSRWTTRSSTRSVCRSRRHTHPWHSWRHSGHARGHGRYHTHRRHHPGHHAGWR